MTTFNLPILDLENEKDFRNVFDEAFLDEKIFFEGFIVKFFPEDFDHICFEYKKGGGYKKKFSLRRARRLLFIKEICGGNIPYVIIHQVERENKSICVLCESSEFALFLIPKVSIRGNYFRIGTIVAYGQKVESKINAQKKKGVLVKKAEEIFK